MERLLSSIGIDGPDRAAWIQALLDGDASPLPATEPLAMWLAQLASQGRVSLSQPAESPLEDLLLLLASSSALLDWADAAPAVAEARVASGLETVEHGLAEVEQFELPVPVLQPWLYLECARLEACRGRDARALARLAQLLQHPLTYRFPGLVERTRELLGSLDQAEYSLQRLEQPYRPSALRNWQRMLKVLTDLPALLKDPSEERVKHACVQFLADLLQPHQVFWLEQPPGHADLKWEVIAYHGPPGFNRFSLNLLAKAMPLGQLISEPQAVSPFESLVLSEARGVMIVLVPGCRAAIYLSHSQFLGRYQEEEAELLGLVARVAGSHLEVQGLHRQRLEVDGQSLQRRRMLGALQDQIGLGLAWLNPEGIVQEANPAFYKHHRRGLAPIWQDLWGPDQARARSWFLQAVQSGGIQSEVFRCERDGLLLWQAYYLDGQAGTSHRLCVVQDLTDQHWEESITLLERERHWVAGDLHDGPAQVAAAEALLEGPNCLASIRELMEWLSSPLYAAGPPEASFGKLMQSQLPEVDFQWYSTLDQWSPRLLVCFRIFQEVVEYLSDRPIGSTLTLTITPADRWTACLEGADCSGYQPSASISHRLELFQGRLQRGHGGLTWELG